MAEDIITAWDLLIQRWEHPEQIDSLDEKTPRCQRLERKLQRVLAGVAITHPVHRETVLKAFVDLEQNDPEVREIIRALAGDGAAGAQPDTPGAGHQTVTIQGPNAQVAVVCGSVEGGIHFARSPETAKIQARVFMSYRRSASAGFVGRLYDHLKLYIEGRIFYDIETLRSGKFAPALLNEIQACDYFLSIVSHDTFTRINEENDWVRQEIEAALCFRKTIIPVVEDKAAFPQAEELPASIRSLGDWNRVIVYYQNFEDCVRKLVEQMRPPK